MYAHPAKNAEVQRVVFPCLHQCNHISTEIHKKIYILKKTRITLGRVQSMGYLQWSSHFPRWLHCQLLDIRTIDASQLRLDVSMHAWSHSDRIVNFTDLSAATHPPSTFTPIAMVCKLWARAKL